MLRGPQPRLLGPWKPRPLPRSWDSGERAPLLRPTPSQRPYLIGPCLHNDLSPDPVSGWVTWANHLTPVVLPSQIPPAGIWPLLEEDFLNKRATVERQFTQRARKGDTKVGTLAYRTVSWWEMKGAPLAMRETCARSLGWEDPLEKGTATHSSILTWRIPWTTAMGSQRVRQD